MPRPFPPVKPAALAEQSGETFTALVSLMQRLLAPDGCPWDREQTYASLRRYVLEEACEVVDAIDHGNLVELREELGDLLMEVVFLGELARAEGAFGPDDIVAGIVQKLVHRHPHVFGDVEVSDADEVLRNWERIKAGERKTQGKQGGVLGGVPRSLPALLRAERVSEKAAKVGFDWPDRSGPRAKVDEELAELDQAVAAGDDEEIAAELGDLLFAVVNLARHLAVDPEAALRSTVEKFTKRFGHVERRVDERHGGFAAGELNLDVLQAYWEESKRSS
ncbi:MAG: nucleoside triphosphate pyrophosphohydrolase [Deltaproteobacteria bacterium]|nr:nucleoside triphosphate pyrophosphohydrolase [Deltaproteobacteria bacterium]